jgi:hypothetical protein
MEMLFLLLLLSATSQCPCQDVIGIDDLTGMWHASTSVGAGYNDVWLFFPDGGFLFYRSSMDWQDRLRSFSGYFDVFGDTLRLVVTEETVEVGGYLVFNDGYTSCASDSMLTDTEVVTRPVDPPETRDMIIDVLRLETRKENPYLPAHLMRLELDGKPWWRFAADPEDGLERLGYEN